VVFLDEMTTGLDPAARRVAAFDQGRVLATGPPHRLVRELGGRTTVRFGWIDGLPALDRVPGVVLVERDGPTVTVIGDDGMLWHLGHALVAAGVELKLFWREPVSVVFTLTLPLLILVVLGGVFGDTPDPEFYRGVGPMTFYAPAYVGLVLGSIAVVVLAWLGYGADLAVSWGGVAVAFVAGALCLAAVGVLLGTVFRTARAALGAGVLLWFVTLFLAGGGPPPEALGRGLRLVGESTPAHYVIRARPCGGRRGHGGVLGVGPAPAAA
jgi:ABC-2 type transport system permease protein